MHHCYSYCTPNYVLAVFMDYSISGLLLQAEFRVFCLLVPLLVTDVYCVKTANTIKNLLRVVDRVGPRNHVLDWGPCSPW